MAYIAGIIAIALFYFILHYFTELEKKDKILATVVIVCIVSGAIIYNRYTTIEQEKMMSVVLKFNQNKTIKCNGVDVNKTNYTLSIGTYTFIGKKDTPNYAQMISASVCK